MVPWKLIFFFRNAGVVLLAAAWIAGNSTGMAAGAALWWLSYYVSFINVERLVSQLYIQAQEKSKDKDLDHEDSK